MSFVRTTLKWIVFRLFRARVTGLEHVDLSKPALLLPNHVSLLDGFFLMLLLPPQTVFVVNTDIARKFATLLRFVRILTVDPLNPYAVRDMIRVVRQGAPLVMFPEGRITVTGGLMKLYGGVGYIATKTGVPVHPIAINGLEHSKQSYLRDMPGRRWFPQTTLSFGKAVRLRGDPDLPAKERKRQATERIASLLSRELFMSRMKDEVNLFDELLSASERYGRKRIVCRDTAQSVSYDQLTLAAGVLGRALAPRLAEQRRVALLMPNAVGHVAALFALIRIGKTPVILNFSSGRQELLDACETAEVRTVLTSRQFVEKAKLQAAVEQLAERCAVVYLEDVRQGLGRRDKLNGWLDNRLRRPAMAGDNEVVLFTSGSEGKPKGVVLSHRNLYANIQQARSVIDFTPNDTVFNAMPMFHSFGLTAGTMLPLLTGMKLYLYPSPLHYKLIPEAVYESNATILFGTPTFLSAYGRAAHPYDFRSVRYAVAGAEKLRDEVRRLWHDKFGIRVLEGYGTTETAPVLTLNTPLACKSGTVGRLLPGIDCVLEQVNGVPGGNLFVRGPNVMKGYLLHGQGFVPAPEWYDCGDVVEIDGEGFLTILSRRKRFAKIGGEMVSLNAVEEWVESCFPGARTAAVQIPDARKGERIVLFHASPDLSAGALKDLSRERGGSPLLLPSRLVFLDPLPVLGNGKTDYVTLQKRAKADVGAAE